LPEQPFRRAGENIKVYKHAVIVSPENMVLGSNIIIDDFVFIGSHRRMILGNYVHVASHSSITGGGRVMMGDFTALSSGVRLISGTDDYTGSSLTNPTIPAEFRNVLRGTIVLEPHVIIGSNAVILPDITVGEGSSVGAGSVVTRDLPPWGVYAGVPARLLKPRPKEPLLETEQRFFEKYGHPPAEFRHASCLDDF
jgi:acetyltransferase-like isoleucine patch superfamily enzyme